MTYLRIFLIRIANAVALLSAVLLLNFLLIHLAPGDVADTIAQSMGGADAEILAQIREDYGLDELFIVQFGRYVGGVVTLDLGYSYFYNEPVMELILRRLPPTLLLVVTAQIVALAVGLLLGVFSSRNPGGATNHFVTVLSLFGFSAPVFWTGILLLIGLSLKLPWFPVSGMVDPSLDGGFWTRALDIARHMTLPVLTLSSIFLALYSRLSRASMMDVLESDYIRTAEAKGLGTASVVYKHALRNAVSPVVTLAGLQLSAVVSGAVVVETVFSWPGLGTLAFESILARDTPTILGILFVSSLVVIVGNLVTDAVHRVVDPRLRRR